MRQFQSIEAQAWHLVNRQESMPMESTCESSSINPVSIVLTKAEHCAFASCNRGWLVALVEMSAPRLGPLMLPYPQLLASHANDP